MNLVERHSLRSELGMSELAYLDHALRGPLPGRSRAAVAGALEAAGRGSLGREALGAEAKRARSALARWLGVTAGELSFHGNGTAAMATVAQGLWRARRVVVVDGDYGSTVLPFLALACRGVRVERVSRDGRGWVDGAALAQAVARPADALVVAAVDHASGERRDLELFAACARRAGAWLVVDASLAAGAVALEPRRSGIDALVTCTRKWLLGPPEVGVLWVAHERLGELAVPAAGALSRVQPLAPLDAAFHEDARRLEGGVLPGPLLAGLASSVELLLEVGRDVVEARTLALAAALATRAAAVGLDVTAPPGSPIVFVTAPAEAGRRLDAAGVVARVLEDGRVRASPHFWNDSTDVDRLVAALAGPA